MILRASRRQAERADFVLGWLHSLCAVFFVMPEQYQSPDRVRQGLWLKILELLAQKIFDHHRRAIEKQLGLTACALRSLRIARSVTLDAFAKVFARQTLVSSTLADHDGEHDATLCAAPKDLRADERTAVFAPALTCVRVVFDGDCGMTLRVLASTLVNAGREHERGEVLDDLGVCRCSHEIHAITFRGAVKG